MTAKEIDAYILSCPYFGGANTIDRKNFADGLTHIGTCGLDFQNEKICPSAECLCSLHMGLKGAE